MCKEAGGGGEGARDTESKTRTPHKDVGKNMQKNCGTIRQCQTTPVHIVGEQTWIDRQNGTCHQANLSSCQSHGKYRCARIPD